MKKLWIERLYIIAALITVGALFIPLFYKAANALMSPQTQEPTRFIVLVTFCSCVIGILLAIALVLLGIAVLVCKRAYSSPERGRPIGLLQTLKLSNYTSHRQALQDINKIQETLVSAGRMADDFQGISDNGFKTRVLKPVLEQAKITFDHANKGDCSIQLKLFHPSRIRELLCDYRKFDFRNEFLTPYMEVSSSKYSWKEPCTTKYKIITGEDGQPEKLEESRHKYATGDACFYVSSAINELFQSSAHPAWIANDLVVHPDPRKRWFYTDSKFFHGKLYKSLALFLICRDFKGASEDNVPIGVLWVESLRPNCFDSDLTFELGKHISNRLYFFLKHTAIAAARNETRKLPPGAPAVQPQPASAPAQETPLVTGD